MVPFSGHRLVAQSAQRSGVYRHILCAKGAGPGFGGNSNQNKQANDAKRDAEKETGKKMTPDQESKFHDAVSHQSNGILGDAEYRHTNT